MILESTASGVKIVPYRRGEGLPVTGKLIILPGHNEIDTKDWNCARKEKGIISDLKRGVLIEHFAKEVVEKVTDEEGKEKPVKVLKAKEFIQLNNQEAADIVQNTFDLKTLKAWKKKEQRESVRVEIINQIDSVKNYTTKDEEED